MTSDLYRTMRYQLAGPMAPLPVLYKEDQSLDCGGLERYVNWLLINGLKNMCFTFTYSQWDFVTSEERLELTRTVANVVGNRGTFVGCTAGGSTRELVTTVDAMRQAGAHTVMVHEPEWVMQNENTGSAHVEYLRTVLQQTDYPLMCCHLPDAWAKLKPLLTLSRFEELCEHENFIGMKDDYYQADFHMALVKRFGDRLAIVDGGMLRKYVVFHRFPCQGVLAGHFSPRWALDLFAALDNNDYRRALEMIEQRQDGISIPAGLHWLAAAQVCYYAMGFAESWQMRPPLKSATDAQAQAVISNMRLHPDLFTCALPEDFFTEKG